jgi:hypothetical protein
VPAHEPERDAAAPAARHGARVYDGVAEAA